MSKGKRKRTRATRPGSFYELSEVIRKIDSGKFTIRSNAAQVALDDFGWGTDEIIKALRLLKEKHFCRSITSTRNPSWVYDVYKGRLLGENVYTHFYIDDDIEGRLIVNSFKEDESATSRRV